MQILRALVLLALSCSVAVSAYSQDAKQMRHRIRSALLKGKESAEAEAKARAFQEINAQVGGLLNPANLEQVRPSLSPLINLESMNPVLSQMPASQLSDFVASSLVTKAISALSNNFVGIQTLAVVLGLPIQDTTRGLQEKILEKAENTTYGAALNIQDSAKFTENLFHESMFVRYLEPSGAGKYTFKCSANSSNKVVQTLVNSENFNSGVHPFPAPVTLEFQITDDNDVVLAQTYKNRDLNAALVCAFFAEEVYHVVLHLMEGIYQYALHNSNTADGDTFLYNVMNMEWEATSEKYAGVEVLGLANNLVWTTGVPLPIALEILQEYLTDYTTFDPFSNINEEDLQAFSSTPMYEMLQNIASQDFGYPEAKDTSVYVNSDITVQTSRNNLVKAQLALAVYHTQTFVWQTVAALPNMLAVIDAQLSGLVLESVLFPEVQTCLATLEDTHNQYEYIVSNGTDASSTSQYDAMNAYSEWLDNYRSSGLTGISSAFSSSNCMSCATWI